MKLRKKLSQNKSVYRKGDIDMGHGIFNDDHDLFRQSVKKFIENEITPHVREWERAGGLPRSLHKRMGEMGYLGVKFPEEYGGSGLDAVTEAVLIEEITKCGAGGVS